MMILKVVIFENFIDTRLHFKGFPIGKNARQTITANITGSQIILLLFIEEWSPDISHILIRVHAV